MKRTFSAIIAICLVALVAVSCNSDKFTIKADIAHLADQRVILNRPGLHGLEPVDTAESVNGKFVFTGKLENNDYRIITFEDMAGEIDLYIDNSNIKITGDYVALDSVKVKGSPAMDYYMKFADIAMSHNNYVKTKLAELQEAQLANDSLKVDEIFADYLVKQKKYIRDNFELAKSRPADMISIFAVVNNSSFSTPDEIKAFYDLVPKSVKEDPRVSEALAQMEKICNLSKGNLVPEFTLHSYDVNETITRDSLNGKTSLVYVTTPDVKDNDVIYPQLHKAAEKGVNVILVMMLTSQDHYFLYDEYVKDMGLDKFHVLTGSEDFIEEMGAVTPRVFAVDKDAKFMGTAIEADDVKDLIDKL